MVRTARAMILLGVLFLSCAAMVRAELQNVYYHSSTVELRGSGILVAQGEGNATLTGKGACRVKGEGTVEIPSGAEYRLAGQAWEVTARTESIVITGKGYVYIRLRQTATVTLTSTRGVLEANGTGTVTLEGKGFYWTKGWRVTSGADCVQ